MIKDPPEPWQLAEDNAHLVREALVRARQIARQDRMGAIRSIDEALDALASLRALAGQSSTLLGTVLFYGIELEVRLGGMSGLPASHLDQMIANEITRSEQLLAAIASHIEND